MVTVRYYAGARAAAAVSEEQIVAASVPQLRSALGARHDDPRFEQVLAVSTLRCDGRPLTEDADLPADAVVEVLPPFAGG